jgi:hypothetical protein
MKIAGIILLVLGVVGVLFGGIQYTTQEKVIDLGPIQASADKKHSFPIAPIASAALLAAGAAVLIVSRKRA